MKIPAGWHRGAHDHWLAGRRNDAVAATVAAINLKPLPFPRDLGLQLAYYASLSGDWAGAAQILGEVVKSHPDDAEARVNQGVCLGRAGRSAESITVLSTLVAQHPDLVVAWDGLAAAHARLVRDDAARDAGARSLQRKHAAACASAGSWQPPAVTPAQWTAGKANVIAFSLWGDNPRYLRGAMHNALLAPAVYPGWQCRFYVDASVPEELCVALRELGADVHWAAAPGMLTTRARLTRRFLVANDPQVGHFLVRDCDAVVSPREAQAVQGWLASGRWFHVMRDWWTHTDLMLAGMWGGVAGVLPDLTALLAAYQSSAVETPNIDQWFLRDRVWGMIQAHTLVHDRCYAQAGMLPGGLPFPGGIPTGHTHVGQDEFAVRRADQEQLLAPWARRLPCLKLSGAA